MSTEEITNQLEALNLHPDLVSEITSYLSNGFTAAKLERLFTAKYGRTIPPIQNMVICAAYYIEAQRKANPQ